MEEKTEEPVSQIEEAARQADEAARQADEAARQAEEAAAVVSLAVAAESTPADRGKVYGDGETLAAQLAATNIGIVTLEARLARLEAVVARQGW